MRFVDNEIQEALRKNHNVFCKLKDSDNVFKVNQSTLHHTVFLDTGYEWFLNEPKKKVKKTIKRWLNIYLCDENIQTTLHTSKTDAESYAKRNTHNLISVAVEMTGEYEVEE
jgi:hypothetical protein